MIAKGRDGSAVDQRPAVDHQRDRRRAEARAGQIDEAFVDEAALDRQQRGRPDVALNGKQSVWSVKESAAKSCVDP